MLEQIQALLLQPLFSSFEPAFGNDGGIAAQAFSEALAHTLEQRS